MPHDKCLIEIIQYYTCNNINDDDIVFLNTNYNPSLDDKYKNWRFTTMQLFLRACYLQCLIVIQEIHINYDGSDKEDNKIIYELMIILLKDYKYKTVKYLYEIIQPCIWKKLYKHHGFVGFANTPFDEQQFVIYNVV